MHCIAVLALLPRMPYKNSKLLIMLIRCVLVSGFFFTGLQEHFVNMFGLFLYKLIFFNRYVLCSESALVLWLVLWAFENP
jgi:hypothetical protein